jgi:hypothetical protein
VYENEAGDLCGAVAVTNRRVLLEDSGHWESIAFTEIASIDTPAPATVEKGEAALTVRLTTGRSLVVPIRGRNGRFFDLFEFSRFLARVREDAISASHSPAPE